MLIIMGVIDQASSWTRFFVEVFVLPISFDHHGDSMRWELLSHSFPRRIIRPRKVKFIRLQSQ